MVPTGTSAATIPTSSASSPTRAVLSASRASPQPASAYVAIPGGGLDAGLAHVDLAPDGTPPPFETTRMPRFLISGSNGTTDSMKSGT